MSKTRKSLWAGAAIVAGLGAVVAALALSTAADVESFHRAVAQAGRRLPAASAGSDAWAGLPAPVQRYFRFTFGDAPTPALAYVEVEMAGRFRRPGRTEFAPTTARQTLAAGTPALMFDATTPVMPGVWARAYDAYIDGRMEMKAKLLSAVALVDEKSSPELDRISLRRWLLESPLYPTALLPGGPVRWEAVDAEHARAVVRRGGVSASMLARFAPDGRLLHFAAEEDGDLDMPYHGSGEFAARDDYRLVGGLRLPMRFQIARAAGGQRFPFWEGHVVRIRLHTAQGLAAQMEAGPPM